MLRTRLQDKIVAANKCFKNVANFKYLETMVTSQNCIHTDIKNRLKSRNTWYHAVQDLLSSRQLHENLKITIYKTIVFHVFCTDVKLGFSRRGTT